MLMSKSKFFVPNLFTSLNFLIGSWALLFASGAIDSPSTSKTALIFACHLILYCVLLDKLDGFAAKVMNASTEFGAQFDSLADLVAFGIAPAVCLFFAYKIYAPDWYAANLGLIFTTFSLYVLCAAMRLARYNAMDSDSLPDWFAGLPSTFAGGANAILLIVVFNFDLFKPGTGVLTGLAVVQILCAVLMVSTLYLPKLKPRKNPLVNGVQVIAIIIGYICGFAMIMTELLFAFVLIYLVFGFSHGLYKRKDINAEGKLGDLDAEDSLM